MCHGLATTSDFDGFAAFDARHHALEILLQFANGYRGLAHVRHFVVQIAGPSNQVRLGRREITDVVRPITRLLAEGTRMEARFEGFSDRTLTSVRTVRRGWLGASAAASDRCGCAGPSRSGTHPRIRRVARSRRWSRDRTAVIEACAPRDRQTSRGKLNRFRVRIPLRQFSATPSKFPTFLHVAARRLGPPCGP